MSFFTSGGGDFPEDVKDQNRLLYELNLELLRQLQEMVWHLRELTGQRPSEIDLEDC